MEPHLTALPNNVTIKRNLAHEEVMKEVHNSDIFLFPSYHPEGFPNAVLEAMALGLPVIASAEGAIPEMIDQGKGGYLVREHNVDQMAALTRKLIKDENLRYKMGRHNRQKSFHNYSYSAVSSKLVEIYASLDR